MLTVASPAAISATDCINTATLQHKAADTAITTILTALTAGEGRQLPKSRVIAQGPYSNNMHLFGPVHRDYSNKMTYVPATQSALYAGGSHQTYRGNDVWEYHLASNSWEVLFEPDGGNMAEHKRAYQILARHLRKGNPLSAKEQQIVAAFKDWWQHNMRFKDGIVTTRQGGPFMPSHTWDGIGYEPCQHRLIWRSGANVPVNPAMLAWLSDIPLKEIEAQWNYDITPMWAFDLTSRRWQPYLQRNTAIQDSLRGMGASVSTLPNDCALLFYVAAQNVTPHVFDMQRYNPCKDEWQSLIAGTSLRQLVTNGDAPRAEAQMAISTRQNKLVAVLDNNTFVFDLEDQRWTTITDKAPFRAHDSKTVFVYDTNNDVFLLFDPKKNTQLAVFSLTTNSWQVVNIKGQPFRPPRWGSVMGYFDSANNVLVIAGGENRRIWVYRYR